MATSLFERILVPVDLAETDTSLVETVITLAEGRQTAVTLLHVIPTVEHVPFDELEQFYDKLQSKAESALLSLEEKLADRKIHTHRAIVYGNRVEEILEYAKNAESSLILMSSHRVEATAPAKGWNSISHTIAIFSPCPVLLLK